MGLDAKGLAIVHDDGYVCALPEGHRFPMMKFSAIMHLLLKDSVVSTSQIISPSKLSQEMASLVHTKEYVQKFFTGKTTAEEQRATGFEWTEGLASRVRLECGGTVLASILALDRGLVASTAGGTHHAFPDRGAGFCLLNDMAVAAKYLVHTGKAKKVLIVDLDVHQGDGTAFIFQDDSSVFTYSMHCEKNFPFRKQKSNMDIHLNAGVGDDEYLKTLAEHLPNILDTFRPDIVIYDAGVDVHEHDELGKLKLSDLGVFKRDIFVMNESLRRGVPVASVVGGGYANNLTELAKRHSIVHRAAIKVWTQRKL